MAKLEKTCLKCNKSFSVYPCEFEKRKYCSRECSVRESKSVKIRCQECGTEFICYPKRFSTSKNHFCSKLCMGKSRRDGGNVVCVKCDKTFYVNGSRLNSAKYCSRKCEKSGEDRICKQCGIEFYAPPSRVKAGEGKFCSKKCYDTNQIDRIERICKKCNSVFYALPASVKNGRGIYCSRECLESRQSEMPIKECIQCGEKFRVKSIKSLGKYCSVKCHNNSRPLIFIDRDCKWCGSKFKSKIHDVKRGYGLFCSKTCLSSHNTYIQGGNRSSIEFAIEEELIKLGIKYETQKRIGRFLVDFFIEHLSLVIECDGDYWHSLSKTIKRDKQKDKWLKRNGYVVIRIPESDIREDPEKALKSRLPSFQLSLF
jgi:very-short-patch-repair endonuclease